MKNIRWMTFFSNVILYAPIAYIIRIEKGLTGSEVFLLQAVMAFSILTFEVPFGVLSDRIGYKKSIILSQVAMVFARLFFLFGQGFTLLLMDVVLLSISGALLSGVLEAYVYESNKSAYADQMTKIYNFASLGFILSNVLFFFVVKSGHFSLISITCLFNVVALIMSLSLPEIKQSDDKIQSVNSSLKMFETLKLVSKKRTFWECSIASGMTAVGMSVFNMLFVVVLSDKGFNVEFMGLVILAYSIFELSIKYAPVIKDKLGIKNYISSIMALITIAFILIGLAHSVPLLLVTGGFVMILSILLSIEVTDRSNQFIDQVGEEDKRASLLSVVNMAGSGVEAIMFVAISSGRVIDGRIFIVVGVGYAFLAIYNKFMQPLRSNQVRGNQVKSNQEVSERVS